MLDASTCSENGKYTRVCAENTRFVVVLEKMTMKIVLENRLENNCNLVHVYSCTLETVNASQESRKTREAPTDENGKYSCACAENTRGPYLSENYFSENPPQGGNPPTFLSKLAVNHFL